MTQLTYTCPKCMEEFIIPQQQHSNRLTDVPGPDPSILKRQFQNHGDHTIFLNFKDQELQSYQIISQLRSVFDTLIYDNIEVSRILNTLLANKSLQFQPLVLYIVDSQSYSRFFAELTRQYARSADHVQIHFDTGFMLVIHPSFLYLLTTFEIGKRLIRKGYHRHPLLAEQGEIHLRSLVIDTTMQQESQLLKQVKKAKFKLSADVRVILAFDTRKHPQPPLALREYFLNQYSANTIQLLNYQDTNGLKSIFLQSYYNLLDDPLVGREAFEILQKEY